MIYLQISEEKYEYDIRGLLMAFYPHEEIEKHPWDTPAQNACEESAPCPQKISRENIPHPQKTNHTSLAVPAPWRRRLRVFYGSSQASLSLSIRTETNGRASLIDLTETAVCEPAQTSQAKSALKRALYRLLQKDTQKTLPWGTLTGIRPTKIAMHLLEQGQTEKEIASYMEQEYLASEEKIRLSLEIACREKQILQGIDYTNGYSLYIGIPFCPTTCLYCSFTSYPFSRYAAQADAYLAAVEQELAWTAKAFRGKTLNTIYFGGGTPTTLEASQLDRLLCFVEQHFDLSNLKELTVEAGRPDSITKEKLRALKQHNISRISINPQTMKQETLDLIGRRHSAAQIREAFGLARESGFNNINMDLILGLPGETIDDVRKTMEELKQLRPDSITVHSLAIKRAARLNQFWEQYAHLSMENSDQTMAVAAAAARELGLFPYYLYRQKNMAGNLENVGYAAPGKEGIYNILIMEEKQTIVACGAGSMSKRVYPDGRIERRENVKDVNQYIERIGEMLERKRVLLSD